MGGYDVGGSNVGQASGVLQAGKQRHPAAAAACRQHATSRPPAQQQRSNRRPCQPHHPQPASCQRSTCLLHGLKVGEHGHAPVRAARARTRLHNLGGSGAGGVAWLGSVQGFHAAQEASGQRAKRGAAALGARQRLVSRQARPAAHCRQPGAEPAAACSAAHASPHQQRKQRVAALAGARLEARGNEGALLACAWGGRESARHASVLRPDAAASQQPEARQGASCTLQGRSAPARPSTPIPLPAGN